MLKSFSIAFAMLWLVSGFAHAQVSTQIFTSSEKAFDHLFYNHSQELFGESAPLTNAKKAAAKSKVQNNRCVSQTFTSFPGVLDSACCHDDPTRHIASCDGGWKKQAGFCAITVKARGAPAIGFPYTCGTARTPASNAVKVELDTSCSDIDNIIVGNTSRIAACCGQTQANSLIAAKGKDTSVSPKLSTRQCFEWSFAPSTACVRAGKNGAPSQPGVLLYCASDKGRTPATDDPSNPNGPNNGSFSFRYEPSSATVGYNTTLRAIPSNNAMFTACKWITSAPGLSLDPKNCTVTGHPSATGTYSVQGSSGALTAQASFTVVANPTHDPSNPPVGPTANPTTVKTTEGTTVTTPVGEGEDGTFRQSTTTQVKPGTSSTSNNGTFVPPRGPNGGDPSVTSSTTVDPKTGAVVASTRVPSQGTAYVEVRTTVGPDGKQVVTFPGQSTEQLTKIEAGRTTVTNGDGSKTTTYNLPDGGTVVHNQPASGVGGNVTVSYGDPAATQTVSTTIDADGRIVTNSTDTNGSRVENVVTKGQEGSSSTFYNASNQQVYISGISKVAIKEATIKDHHIAKAEADTEAALQQGYAAGSNKLCGFGKFIDQSLDCAKRVENVNKTAEMGTMADTIGATVVQSNSNYGKAQTAENMSEQLEATAEGTKQAAQVAQTQGVVNAVLGFLMFKEHKAISNQQGIAERAFDKDKVGYNKEKAQVLQPLDAEKVTEAQFANDAWKKEAENVQYRSKAQGGGGLETTNKDSYGDMQNLHKDAKEKHLLNMAQQKFKLNRVVRDVGVTTEDLQKQMRIRDKARADLKAAKANLSTDQRILDQLESNEKSASSHFKEMVDVYNSQLETRTADIDEKEKKNAAHIDGIKNQVLAEHSDAKAQIEQTMMAQLGKVAGQFYMADQARKAANSMADAAKKLKDKEGGFTWGFDDYGNASDTLANNSGVVDGDGNSAETGGQTENAPAGPVSTEPVALDHTPDDTKPFEKPPGAGVGPAAAGGGIAGGGGGSGGGSAATGAAERQGEETGAQYAAAFGGKGNGASYEAVGGGRGGGGSGSGGADVAGMLAALMPKEQEFGKNQGILEFKGDRAPSSGVFSLLGKEVNLFQRVSERYNWAAKEKRVDAPRR